MRQSWMDEGGGGIGVWEDEWVGGYVGGKMNA